MLTCKQLNDICDELQGSCKMLEDVVTNMGLDYDDLTVAELQEIDNCVACCECCGWWFEPCELDGWGNCEGCSDEDEDD